MQRGDGSRDHAARAGREFESRGINLRQALGVEDAEFDMLAVQPLRKSSHLRFGRRDAHQPAFVFEQDCGAISAGAREQVPLVFCKPVQEGILLRHVA